MKLSHYVAATAAGEATAQVTSAWLAEVAGGYAGTNPSIAPYVLPFTLVLAGAMEGLCVGLAQGFVLRAVAPVRAFALATTLAMMASWIMGAVVSLVEPASMPGPMLLLGIAGVLGLVVGFSLGLAQDRVLERAGVPSSRFVGYSALAWCCAHVTLTILAQRGDFVLSSSYYALRGVSGLIAGTIVGLVAGPALVHALPER